MTKTKNSVQDEDQVINLQHIKKLVPWGTDGRLPLSGDFRSLIL